MGRKKQLGNYSKDYINWYKVFGNFYIIYYISMYTYPMTKRNASHVQEKLCIRMFIVLLFVRVMVIYIMKYSTERKIKEILAICNKMNDTQNINLEQKKRQTSKITYHMIPLQ